MNSRSPVHLTVEKDQPVHLVLSPPKSRTSSRSKSPKRTPSKRAVSPAKEKPWIPAPCKSSKNKYTWSGSKSQLDITTPLTEPASQLHITVDSHSPQPERPDPGLLDNVNNYRARLADLTAEIDTMKAKADLRERQKEIGVLRDELNTSMHDTLERDAEITAIQDDLYNTEIENELLRNSLKQIKLDDTLTRKDTERLNAERDLLLKRLVQAEADAQAAKRGMLDLRSAVGRIQSEKDVCKDDTERLSAQRELLLSKCADSEESNRKLRSELRENQRKQVEGSKLKEQQEVLLTRLSQADSSNKELKGSLMDMDRQISKLSAQVTQEKEEAEAYKHLQRTSEMSRSRTADQLHESMTENAKLERRMIALEEDIALERREHERTKGVLAGTIQKSHTDKDALRDKLKSYKERALRNEEALEAVSANLASKSVKGAELESEAELLHCKIEKLLRDNENLADTVARMRRQEIEKDEDGERLQMEVAELRSRKADAMQRDQISQLKHEQLKISLDSLTEKVKEKEEEAASTASANDAEVTKLQASLESYQALVNEQKSMLDRLQRENADMMSRITATEHANGVALHDSYLETEKTKVAYQTQIAELSLYPERLKTAEARYNESEESRAALQDKLNDSNQTISSLNGKIDMLSESINSIREKYHVVTEDNIELSAKSQAHERKALEADDHNKNLIAMVTKKDDTIEAQQPAEPSAPAETELDGKPASPPSPSSTTDNNASEEDTPVAAADLMEESESESETSESSESEDEVDWSAMLKDAEANKARLGMDVIESSGESEEDENGVRVKKKDKVNGLTTQDMLNRMATNELLGYDEFGRPITSKHQKSVTGLSSHNRRHKKRSLLFGTDTKSRNKTKGSNNRSVNKEGKSGGRRSKNKGGGAMLLGF